MAKRHSNIQINESLIFINYCNWRNEIFVQMFSNCSLQKKSALNLPVADLSRCCNITRTVLLRHCVTVSLCCRVTVLPCHYVSVLLSFCHCVAVSLCYCHCVTVSLCYCYCVAVLLLLSCCVTVLLCYCYCVAVLLLLCCCVTVLLCYCYCVAVLLCCCVTVTVSLCCCVTVTLLLCYCATIAIPCHNSVACSHFVPPFCSSSCEHKYKRTYKQLAFGLRRIII
jgi:hypothetical protein